jgi:hypothetical protein
LGTIQATTNRSSTATFCFLRIALRLLSP